MKPLALLLLLSLFYFLQSCQKKDTNEVEIATSTIITKNAICQDCKHAGKAFFEWYKENIDTLLKLQSEITFVNNTGYYDFDVKSKEKYILYLDSSGLFSPKFILKIDSNVTSKLNNLKLTKREYGPPAGFLGEFLFRTQEPEVIYSVGIQTSDSLFAKDNHCVFFRFTGDRNVYLHFSNDVRFSCKIDSLY
jgi:hypothetical protein